jgi:acetyltransferase-like isoleucine patch superfamily enzyme
MNEGYFVHEKGLCESSHIGNNTRIWAFTHVMKGAKIGTNCNIGDHCFIENGVTIGNDVTIKNGVSIWDGVRIEDKVFLGPNVVFTNDKRPRSKVHSFRLMETLIKKGASIGANATLLCSIKIGKFAIIGAGSVVTKDVPEYTLVYGNPAKIRGYVCECGNNLEFRNSKAKCKCGLQYELKDNICIKMNK